MAITGQSDNEKADQFVREALARGERLRQRQRTLRTVALTLLITGLSWLVVIQPLVSRRQIHQFTQDCEGRRGHVISAHKGGTLHDGWVGDLPAAPIGDGFWMSVDREVNICLTPDR